MKKVLFFFLLMALCFPLVLRAQNESKPFVHCIVLDKTKSMIGRDGTKQGTTNIWKEVQDYCCGMIDGFSPSSTVLFYTFDKGLYGPDVFEINGEVDKTAVKNKVRNVSVDGNYTWIASNLAKVIESVYKQYADHSIMIYLLTDGLEEQQPCNIQKVISDYDGYVGDYDHLYYVDLRDTLRNSKNTTAKEFKDAFEKGKHSDIVVGYPKIVSMHPMINPVTYEFDDKSLNDREFEIPQYFQVTSGKLTEDFTFEVFVPGGNANGLNLDISPSKLSVKQMKKENDEGKYSVKFKVKIVNNASIKNGSIPVSLKGCRGENTLSIEPSGFTIEVKKANPVVFDTIRRFDTIRSYDTIRHYDTIHRYDTIPVRIHETPKMDSPDGWE